QHWAVHAGLHIDVPSHRPRRAHRLSIEQPGIRDGIAFVGILSATDERDLQGCRTGDLADGSVVVAAVGRQPRPRLSDGVGLGIAYARRRERWTVPRVVGDADETGVLV